MHVSLSPELELIVNEKVASGEYRSAREVVGEALRLLKERDERRQEQIEELRSEIRIGLEQLDRGEATVYDEESLKDLFERIKARGQIKLSGHPSKSAP